MKAVNWRRYTPRRIGYEPYVYLIWLLFLFSQPIFDPEATWFDWVLVPVIILAFIPLNLHAWVADRRGKLFSIGLMCVMAMVLLPLNSGTGSFFIYAAAAAAFAAPPARARRLIVAILGLVLLTAPLTGIPWPYVFFYLVPVLFMTGLIGFVNIFEAQKARATARLRQANEEIERLATIAERERIARDLHDLLGHTLSMITLKSELASKLAARDPNRAAQEMREVEEISRKALSEVRVAVRGFRTRGLAAELDDVDRALRSAGVEFRHDMEPVELRPAQESALAMALREATTNVIRHSGATTCEATLRRENGSVVLTVADDGSGEEGVEGSGLQGMRERLEKLGGNLERRSNGGTTITATVPVAVMEAGN